jgi:hypothetical protein
MAAQATGAKSLTEFWPVTWEAWFIKWPEPTPIMLLPSVSSTENKVGSHATIGYNVTLSFICLEGL